MSSSSFTPSQILTFFHNIPRATVSGEKAPSSFPSDLTSITAPYFQAILLQSGSLVAWGALSCLIFAAALLSAALCCRSSKPPTGCCCRARRACFALWTLAMLGPIIAGLATFPSWRTGVDGALSAAQGFSNAVAAASATVSGPLAAAQGALQGQAANLAFQAQATSVAAAAVTFNATISDALATTATLSASLAQASAFLTTQLSRANDASAVFPNVDLAQLRNGLSTGTWAVIGSGLAWLVFMFLTLSNSRCAALCFRTTAPVAWALGALLPALAGLLFGLSLLGSDACVAPAAAASSLLNYTNAPTFAAGSVIFYATCTPGGVAPGGTPAGGAAAAITAMNGAWDAVTALNASVASDGTTPALALLPLLGDISASIVAANGSAGVLAAAVACAPLQTLWLSLLGGLCNEAVAGVANTAFPCIASALAMTVLLCIAVSLCKFHGGDVVVGDEGGRGAVETTSMLRFGYRGGGAMQEWGGTGGGRAPKYATTRYERDYGTA